MTVKIVRAQLYIPYNIEERIVTYKCSDIDKELEGWPVYYDCFIGDNNNEDVIGFEVECEASTFKDADALYQMFKKLIYTEFKCKPKEKIKMKLERII